MQECVDKQECNELRVRKFILGSLLPRLLKADDDLATAGIGGIREHIRDVALLSEASVKSLSLGGADEGKGYFPAREKGFRYA